MVPVIKIHITLFYYIQLIIIHGCHRKTEILLNIMIYKIITRLERILIRDQFLMYLYFPILTFFIAIISPFFPWNSLVLSFHKFKVIWIDELIMKIIPIIIYLIINRTFDLLFLSTRITFFFYYISLYYWYNINPLECVTNYDLVSFHTWTSKPERDIGFSIE